MLVRILSAFALLSTSAWADLACKPYFSKGGATKNSGVITYTTTDGSGFFSYVNLNVGNPAFLDRSKPAGTTFNFRTCNSTSLKLKAHADNDSAGCPVTYIDYIQVINPATGNCLTSIPIPNTTLYKLVPKKCYTNGANTTQLFLAAQKVYYGCSEGGGTFYNAPGYYAIDAQKGRADSNPAQTWLAASDNRTVEFFKATGKDSDLMASISFPS